MVCFLERLWVALSAVDVMTAKGLNWQLPQIMSWAYLFPTLCAGA